MLTQAVPTTCNDEYKESVRQAAAEAEAERDGDAKGDAGTMSAGWCVIPPGGAPEPEDAGYTAPHMPSALPCGGGEGEVALPPPVPRVEADAIPPTPCPPGATVATQDTRVTAPVDAPCISAVVESDAAPTQGESKEETLAPASSAPLSAEPDAPAAITAPEPAAVPVTPKGQTPTAVTHTPAAPTLTKEEEAEAQEDVAPAALAPVTAPVSSLAAPTPVIATPAALIAPPPSPLPLPLPLPEQAQAQAAAPVPIAVTVAAWAQEARVQWQRGMALAKDTFTQAKQAVMTQHGPRAAQCMRDNKIRLIMVGVALLACLVAVTWPGLTGVVSRTAAPGNSTAAPSDAPPAITVRGVIPCRLRRQPRPHIDAYVLCVCVCPRECRRRRLQPWAPPTP